MIKLVFHCGRMTTTTAPHWARHCPYRASRLSFVESVSYMKCWCAFWLFRQCQSTCASLSSRVCRWIITSPVVVMGLRTREPVSNYYSDYTSILISLHLHTVQTSEFMSSDRSKITNHSATCIIKHHQNDVGVRFVETRRFARLSRSGPNFKLSIIKGHAFIWRT